MADTGDPLPTSDNNSPNNDDKLQYFLSEREIIVGKLTRFATFLDEFDDSKLIELETRIEHLPSMAHQFDLIQGQIEALDSAERSQRNRESFENSYFKVLACGRNYIVQVQEKMDKTSQVKNKASTGSTQNKFSLPPIELPKFDGDYKKWLFFIQRFSALVHKNTQLSNVEKFYYLQGRLQGEALEVIQDLPLAEQNYPIALGLLTDRYENKRVIVDKHIEDLFNLPEVVNESSIQLRKLIDSLKQHVRSLKALGEPTESWDRLLIHLIKSKLDKTTRDRWQEQSHSKPTKSPPTLAEMVEFLVCRCEYLESLDKNKLQKSQSIKHSSSKTTHNFKQSHSFASITPTTPDSRPVTCFFCQSPHAIYQCTTFINLALDEKYKELKRLGLCTNCLKKGHYKIQCTSGSCRHCHGKHNSLLRPSHTQPQSTSSPNLSQHTHSPIQGQNQPPPAQSACTSISGHTLDNNLVLLSTAIIFIKDIHGQFHEARALLDVGSQSNYATTSLIKKLQLGEQNVNISISGVGNSNVGVFRQTFTTIKSMHSNYQQDLSFLILPKIADQIPNFHFNIRYLNIPHNIALADPSLDKPGEIDILLGASYFYELLEAQQLSLGKGKPLLQSTKLGWILAGIINFPLNSKVKPQKSLCWLTLNQQLTKFWEIEETPVKKHLSFEETFCETFFKV